MKQLAILITVLFGQWLTAQDTDQKVILITMDGYRWQELFSGGDLKWTEFKLFEGRYRNHYQRIISYKECLILKNPIGSMRKSWG